MKAGRLESPVPIKRQDQARGKVISQSQTDQAGAVPLKPAKVSMGTRMAALPAKGKSMSKSTHS